MKCKKLMMLSIWCIWKSGGQLVGWQRTCG